MTWSQLNVTCVATCIVTCVATNPVVCTQVRVGHDLHRTDCWGARISLVLGPSFRLACRTVPPRPQNKLLTVLPARYFYVLPREVSKWGAYLPYHPPHENQTPRSDVVKYCASSLSLFSKLLEPRYRCSRRWDSLAPSTAP